MATPEQVQELKEKMRAERGQLLDALERLGETADRTSAASARERVLTALLTRCYRRAVLTAPERA